MLAYVLLFHNRDPNQLSINTGCVVWSFLIPTHAIALGSSVTGLPWYAAPARCDSSTEGISRSGYVGDTAEIHC